MGDPAGNAPTVDFWFDFASTYSYPAAMTIDDRAAELGIQVAWRPFLLGPIFAAQGWDDSPFNIYPAKGQYMWRDLERICADLELPFQRPKTFPQNSVKAAKIALRFLARPYGHDLCRDIFLAEFGSGKDISKTATIVDAVEAYIDPTDLPRETVLRTLSEPSQLRDQTEMARALGIFGAPTFMVGNEMFWGFDRMEAALAWAKNTVR